MSEKYFNYTDVLGFGWETMKRNLGFFIGLGLLVVVITYSPTIALLITKSMGLSSSSEAILSASIQVIGFLINSFIGIGTIKIALAFCDEQMPTIGTLFDAFDCFWRYLAVSILYLLIIYAGFFLLIVPGIIWAVKFSLCYYFVVDKGMGPIEALKASARTTEGAKWQLCGFGAMCGLINLLGLLCFIVGFFAAFPTVIVAVALVYRQLLMQTHDLEEFGIVAIPEETEEPETEFENPNGWRSV